MKVADMGPAVINILQLMKRDQGAFCASGARGKQEVERAGTIAQVSMSTEGYELQQVAALAEQSNELQAEKVKRLKAQIEQGTYHVEAAEVAKAVAQSAIARLLDKSHSPPRRADCRARRGGASRGGTPLQPGRSQARYFRVRPSTLLKP